jgi:hypothetical protein
MQVQKENGSLEKEGESEFEIFQPLDTLVELACI